MRVSDHLLARLAKEGIDTAFTVYGGAISELMDAFTRQSAIRYIVPMHEQAAAFGAEGYAKMKGVPGLAIATSGPGGQNMVTGIANCYYDSTPCIFITGQVQTKFMRPDNRIRQLGFQESPIVDIVREITKYAVTVKDVRYFDEQLEDAIHLCKSGRPGSVLLDIPGDVQRAEMP
jgi:acetolactate synthase I/II/III large subunit